LIPLAAKREILHVAAADSSQPSTAQRATSSFTTRGGGAAMLCHHQSVPMTNANFLTKVGADQNHSSSSISVLIERAFVTTCLESFSPMVTPESDS
jgi:hypothetical protein